jgi:hypothetical protein
MGTVRRPDGRRQPFTLVLRSFSGRSMVRCVSPVGRLLSENGRTSALAERVRDRPVQIGALPDDRFGSYDLNAEGEVLLSDAGSDVARLGWLVARVTGTADDLERDLLGRDEPLAVFREDLEKESPDAGR